MITKKRGVTKKGDKPLDTGYPALIPDLPTGKGGKNPMKLQLPALDDPSSPVIVEEQTEKETAK